MPAHRAGRRGHGSLHHVAAVETHPAALHIADKKLSKSDEQKVKLSAKNLYKKLCEQKDSLLVVDWYKDEQPKARMKSAIELSLNADLPESYDASSFKLKTDLLLNHFIDMAVQGYGWIGKVA